MNLLSSKSSHALEVAVVVLYGLGNLAAAIADKLSPHWASIDTAIAVAALAIARGLSNIGTNGNGSPGAGSGGSP